MKRADLKPMATAPKDKRILAAYNFHEMGTVQVAFGIVYWTNPWDGMPGGWNIRYHGDFQDCIGWVMEIPSLDD